MSNKNNMQKIMLEYYKGLFDEEELELYKFKLKSIDIELMEYDKTNKPMNSLEDFTNEVSLIISDPIVQSIIMNLINNASYDVLKSTIIWMWNSLIGKKITKVTSGGKCDAKEATFGLSLYIENQNKIDLRLSGDISDTDKEKCIDRAFEFIKDSSLKIPPHGNNFAKYDYEKEEWILIDIVEEINKLHHK